MKNAPIEMGHYKLRVVEPAALKMKAIYKDNQRVGEEPAVGPNGEALYEAVLYIRARQADQYNRKDSEEIKVELAQPCEDIDEDDVVELVGSRITTKTYSRDGRQVLKLEYLADGMTKVG